VRHSR